MAKVTEMVFIHAPVEQVFDFVRDTENLPHVWPNLMEIKDLQPLPNGGSRFRCVYNMLGFHFEVASEDAEFVLNERIVSKTSGGIQSTITWLFEPENGWTKLVLEAEYTIPAPLIGKLAERLVARMNQRDIEDLLNNMKVRFARQRGFGPGR